MSNNINEKIIQQDHELEESEQSSVFLTLIFQINLSIKHICSVLAFLHFSDIIWDVYEFGGVLLSRKDQMPKGIFIILSQLITRFYTWYMFMDITLDLLQDGVRKVMNYVWFKKNGSKENIDLKYQRDDLNSINNKINDYSHYLINFIIFIKQIYKAIVLCIVAIITWKVDYYGELVLNFGPTFSGNIFVHLLWGFTGFWSCFFMVELFMLIVESIINLLTIVSCTVLNDRDPKDEILELPITEVVKSIN